MQLTKELDIINNNLSRRGSRNANNKSNIAASMSYSVAFKPHLIPTKIKLNSKGEVSFQTEYSVPTPLGIFSISSEVVFKNKRTLIILSGKRKYIYDLGEKPFVFDFSAASRKPRIAYDGLGSIKVTL